MYRHLFFTFRMRNVNNDILKHAHRKTVNLILFTENTLNYGQEKALNIVWIPSFLPSFLPYILKLDFFERKFVFVGPLSLSLQKGKCPANPKKGNCN